MNAMRKILAALLAVCLCATFAADASAALDFPAIRDTGLSGHSTEVLVGLGQRYKTRSAKTYQHQSLFDFDVAAVQAYINANMPIGFTAQATLTVYIASDPADAAVNVSAIQSVNDWVEGDGTGTSGPMLWTLGTADATTLYAQTLYTEPGGVKTVDTVNSVPWTDGAGAVLNSFRDIYDNPSLVNSLTLDYLATMTSGDPVSVVLDDALLTDLLTNANNRGLYTSSGVSINTDLYMREQAAGAFAPTLTIDFVPEPATLSLLAIGGLALIRRRRTT